jgi:hypothetical protein
MTKPIKIAARTKPALPLPGAKVVCVCGPCESSSPQYAQPENVGTVLTLITDRWGTHALVLWGDGKTEGVHTLTTCGIGVYLASGMSTTDY